MNVQGKRLMPWPQQNLGGRWIRLLGACLMVPLLTSCAGTGPVIDAGCLWTREIRVSQQDIITDPTARQILGHNKARGERCSG